MNVKTEKTFTIDGMLEGPLRGESDRHAMQSWVSKAKATGFPFHLSIDASTYSLMPESGPLPLPGGVEGVDVPLTDLLNAFVATLDPSDAGASMSTIRTSEYRPGTEVQTIYALEPGGTIKPQQRLVDVKTAPPPEPLSTKALLKHLGVAILIVGVLFAATYPFVPYGKLFASFMPVKAKEIDVQLGPFDEILQVQKRWIAKRMLVIEIGLAPPLAGDPKALNEAYFSSRSIERRLALEAVVKRRINIVVTDARNRVIARDELPLESIVVPLKQAPKEKEPKTRKATAIRIPLVRGIRKVVLVL